VAIGGGRKFRDGLPEFIRNISISSPHVPTELQHAKCNREVLEFPFTTTVDEQVWNFELNRILNCENISYCSEADVVHYIKVFFDDIMRALKMELSLTFRAEVSIQNIRPDLCALLYDQLLVGVVEIKKPGRNVLLEPTVLGELFDQMLVVEGFYGMGPVIGILTTGEEWVVAWFPCDSDALTVSHQPKLEESSKEESFSTPKKPTAQGGAAAEEDETTDGGDPDENISRRAMNSAKKEKAKKLSQHESPSQRSGTIHQISTDPNINQDGDQLNHRRLNTTPVLNSRNRNGEVLQLLSNALHCMIKARKYHYTGAVPRCFVGFHKDEAGISFHPKTDHDSIDEIKNRHYFPRSDVKVLVALEDLGRGASGKAWLCTTIARTAVCVLKFHNSNDADALRIEVGNWRRVYPEFKDKVSVHNWSGKFALMMPHFSTVLKTERDSLKKDVKWALMNKFVAKELRHNDVEWRNIGKYKDAKSGATRIVLFDLEAVVASSSKDWVGAALANLYPDDIQR